MTEQNKAEQELIENIATAFKIAREEGAIHRFADGVSDTEEVMGWFKEAGYRLQKELRLSPSCQ